MPKLWLASIRSLQELVDDMILVSYGAQSSSDSGAIDGVPAIPGKGSVSQDGVSVKDHKLYNAVGRLDNEIWWLVERYDHLLKKRQEHGE
jgi:hypothetical protein